MFCLEFACVFRLSVSIRKVASEHPFCVLIYMNSYISHIYLFHFIYFLVKHTSNIVFYMLDVIIGRHTWNCQIRTHMHTKIHTHTRTHKVEKVGEDKRGKKWWVGEERKKRKKGPKEKEGEKKEENARKEGGRTREKRKREGDGFRGVEERGY